MVKRSLLSVQGMTSIDCVGRRQVAPPGVSQHKGVVLICIAFCLSVSVPPSLLPSLPLLPPPLVFLPWTVSLILLVWMNWGCEGVCHMAYSLGSLHSSLGGVVSLQAFSSWRFCSCRHKTINCHRGFEETQSGHDRASRPNYSVRLLRGHIPSL